MQWSVYLNNQNEEYKVIEVIILPFPLEFKNSNVMQRSQQLDVSFGNKKIHQIYLMKFITLNMYV